MDPSQDQFFMAWFRPQQAPADEWWNRIRSRARSSQDNNSDPTAWMDVPYSQLTDRPINDTQSPANPVQGNNREPKKWMDAIDFQEKDWALKVLIHSPESKYLLVPWKFIDNLYEIFNGGMITMQPTNTPDGATLQECVDNPRFCQLTSHEYELYQEIGFDQWFGNMLLFYADGQIQDNNTREETISHVVSETLEVLRPLHGGQMLRFMYESRRRTTLFEARTILLSHLAAFRRLDNHLEDVKEMIAVYRADGAVRQRLVIVDTFQLVTTAQR